MTNLDNAIDTAAAIRSGETTAADVLEEHLRRIDRLDPVLNAVCLRDDDAARSRAAEIDAEIAAGRADRLGPFAGVPMLIKDLNDAKGWPTTMGSRATSDHPAATDDLAVARLRDAGFVFTGKTTTPEFGSISVTESEIFGPTRSPWDTDRTPGGSSGGAGAAVAAGILPASHSSDGGGSIRIPASCNGLVGLKCSRYRITTETTKMAGASTQGVVARTVVESAAVTDAMIGEDPGAWAVAPPLARPLASEVGADPGKLRIKVATANAMGIDPAPECVLAVKRTIEVLEGLGHTIDDTPLRWPDPGVFLDGFLTVWSTATSGFDVDEDLLEPHNQANRRAARETDAIRFSEAVMGLQRESRAFTEPFGRDFDVLLSPTMAIEPPPVGWIWEGSGDDPSAPMTNATPMAAYTALFNVTGQPAISLPVHMSPSGLPIGVQVAAPPAGEALLVRLASQVEQVVRWQDRERPDPTT